MAETEKCQVAAIRRADKGRMRLLLLLLPQAAFVKLKGKCPSPLERNPEDLWNPYRPGTHSIGGVISAFPYVIKHYNFDRDLMCE